MVDIQSGTVEIRRGKKKKEEEETTGRKYNIRKVDVFSGVCLCFFVSVFVCRHYNFRTTKHMTIKLCG